MAAGGTVLSCPTLQVHRHGSYQWRIDRETKIGQRELGRECLSSFGGSQFGIADFNCQSGSNSRHRLSTQALAEHLSSHLISAGRSSSIPVTREGCLRVRLSGQTSKSLLRKYCTQGSSGSPIPWTAWRMGKLVQGIGKKEKERRRIVHPMTFLGKQRSVVGPEYLADCSRIGAYQRCGVSVSLPEKHSSRPIMIQAQKENSPERSGRTAGKLQTVSKGSSEKQGFDVPAGAFSSAGLTTAQATDHSVKSRAWTAWKRVLTSSSFELRESEIPSKADTERAIRYDQNSCTFTWHCSPPLLAENKLGVLKLESQEPHRSKECANIRTIKPGKDCLGLVKTDQKQDLVANRPHSKLSPRDLAVGAIIRALTPNLDQKKNGQGELALRMADFVAALKASAQTNEIKHCERQVQACLSSMIDGAELAQLDFDIFQLWLDVTEMQLLTAPREADVLQLLTFLEDIQSRSYNPQRVDSVSPNDSDCMTRDGYATASEVDKGRRLDSILQAAQQLEQILANMPSSAEISAKITSERINAQKGLQGQAATTTAAFRQYREALGKGEVAWFQNIDKISSRLESVARIVLPMETAFDAP